MKLMKWIVLLVFLQCFVYKTADSPLTWNVGLLLTPPRLVLLIILVLGALKVLKGELQFPTLGTVGGCMVLFALTCTVSSIESGNALERSSDGYVSLTRLFDFVYAPLLVFLIVKSISHSQKKLEFISCSFQVLGAYLAINGAFEQFGLHDLVWPKYILDPSVGTQWGRTRGSFASSTYLGWALIVALLFCFLSTTRAKRGKRYWAYVMIFVSVGVIYATQQRSVWLGFGFGLALLAIVKSRMRRTALVVASVTCLGFFGGVASKFNLMEGTLFSKRQETVEYRWVNYATLLEMSKANPVFGIGWGNWTREWPKYMPQVPGIDTGRWIDELTDGNHNTFLGLLAEVGLVGTVPYLLILYSMFRAGLRVFRRERGLEREFALIFLIVVSSYIIDSNFHDSRSAYFSNTVLFLLFGTVAGIRVKEHSQTTGRSRTLGVSKSEWNDGSFQSRNIVEQISQRPRSLASEQ